jgi:hypothetical protein
MRTTFNIITAFCLPFVNEKIARLKGNLERRGMLPAVVHFEQGNFDMENENLFFISFNRKNENELRNLVRKTNFRKRNVIIISDSEADYFDFAMEYNICNIINIDELNEAMLLGIIKRFSEDDLSMEPFFKREDIIFEKRYYISGVLNMRNLVENLFPDFTEKIEGVVRNMFIINCHELITNAIAYGIMGVTPYARDKKAYEFENTIEIPKGKGLQVNLLLDARSYGISVRDYGGVLTTQRVLERIRRQSVVAGETVPQGIEDLTGRGLAILSHHGLLMFSIKPGVFTDVSLIGRLNPAIEKKPISVLMTEL